MPGYELIGKEEKEAVGEIFDKGGVLYRYGLDAKRQNIFRVEQFEKEVAKKVGSQYCLCVCNGTAALKLGLFALGVKPGDEVITQTFTFVATAEAILELGAVPVMAEIDKSLNMDPNDLEKKITSKTKAIIPVHMGGVSARMDEIMAIAKKHNIPVLEDSCQAMGGKYKGKYLGTIGDIGCYSLDIGKIITTGEGGLLVTDNKELYQKAKEYSDHGHECNPALPRGKDTRTFWGFNYKATEFHGAVGLAQLKKLDYILSRQKENKKKIKEAIQGLEFRDLPDPEGDAGDTLIFFAKDKEKANLFAKILAEKGLGVKNLPDAVSWHFACYWDHMFEGRDLIKEWSQSFQILSRAVALPIMVNMEQSQIEKIIQTIKENESIIH